MLQEKEKCASAEKGNSTQAHHFVENISPQQAWELLHNEKAFLVDVRTSEELPTYGKPDLSNVKGRMALIPWRLSPSFEANPHFEKDLKQSAERQESLLFLCKAGGRSYEATQFAQELGFNNCYNIEGGMDGENGWKAAELPWGGAA